MAHEREESFAPLDQEGENTSAGQSVSEIERGKERVRAMVGIGLINRLNYIILKSAEVDDSFDDTLLSDEVISLSEKAVFTAQYYKFCVGAGMMGINLLEMPELSEEEREEDKFAYDWGAGIVASKYLQDHPDNPLAKVIMEEGINAPLEAHQSFYRLVEHSIFRFTDVYNQQHFGE